MCGMRRVDRRTAACFFTLTVTRIRCSLTGRGITAASALCQAKRRQRGVTSVDRTSLLALGLSTMGTHGALGGTRVTLGHTVFDLTSCLGFSGGARVHLHLPDHPHGVRVSISGTLRLTHTGGPAFLRLHRRVLRTRRRMSGAGGRTVFGTRVGTDIKFGRISGGVRSTCGGLRRRRVISLSISVPLMS